jgi:TROVE domain
VMVDSVLQRADEPGELLAYWTSRYGKAIPKPVKRGTADAVRRLYTERNLLKYDTDSHGFRFGDVLDLTHPAPGAPWQGDLFRYALDRRHGRGNEVPIELAMLTANALLRKLAEAEPEVLLNAEQLREAGMTWEDALSLVGAKVDKARLWEALIPSMGYMALLRNLRNFDQAGVSDTVAAQVAARLADPEQVARSRQFPFRFLAAYRNAPSLRWGHALDQALTHSLANVPELAGRTLVLVDRSGSMFHAMSAKSELTYADSAAIFGTALAVRNHGRVTLVQYGNASAEVSVGRGESLLKVLDRFQNLGGTETARAVRQHYVNHDRVVIVTDEQAWAGYGRPGDHVPQQVPLYTFNLVGYRHGHEGGGPNRVTIGGGLTDHAFRLIPLLEAGKSGPWPWLGQPSG